MQILTELKPSTYNYKAKLANQNKLPEDQQYGFIAQELEKVLPNLVIEENLKTIDGTAYKGIEYQQLIPILLSLLTLEYIE